MSVQRIAVSLLLGALLLATAPVQASADLLRSTYQCHRTLIQRGTGGESGIDASYDNLAAMVEARHNPWRLWTVYNDCLRLHRDLGPSEQVSRGDYYTRIADLTGVDRDLDDPEQRQLYVLMAGLRDNVARCGTITGAGAYGLIFGAAADTTAGVCQNLEGKNYLKLGGGYGVALGVGANLALFVDDRLALYPEETGNLGEILWRVASTVAQAVIQPEEPWGPSWFDVLGVNVYALVSAGGGVAVPLSALADSPDAVAALESCLAGFTALLEAGNGIDLETALADLGACLEVSSGIAVGGGLQLVLAFDLPIHVGIPLVRTPWLLRDVVYGGVSTTELILVKQRADFFVAFGS